MTSAGAWKMRFQPFLTGRTQEKEDGTVEYAAWCPSCEDPDDSKTPSGHFNFDKGVFHCKSEDASFSYSNLWSIVKEDMSDSKNGDSPSRSSSAGKRKVRLPTERQLERFRADLFGNPDILQAFKDQRGLNEETITKYGIGYDSAIKRYTIPIYDGYNTLVGVRRYRMNAKESKNKMIGYEGHNEARLYPLDALDEETIILVEGELDALILRQFGFNAMTHTSGAKSFKGEWAPNFEDKIVFVCYDNDESGDAGANITGTKVGKYAKEVYIVRLNISIKGGDVTDYFVKQGNTASDFQDLLDDARVSTANRVRAKRLPEGDPDKVSVEDSMDPKHSGYPVWMIGTVAGKYDKPFMLPKKVNFTCEMDWGQKCEKCPMKKFYNGHKDQEIDKRDSNLLAWVDRSTEARDKDLLKLMDIPPTCPKVDINVDESWAVEELSVQPSIEDRGEIKQNPVNRVVYNIGEFKTPVNTSFKITGTNTPHPKSQESVFQGWEMEPVQTDVDKFEMTEEIYEELRVFQREPDEKPLHKMRDIAADMAANVTKIYGRPELHMAYDLVWHSAMSFRLADSPLPKGWLEMLVVGDTRTGKSEVAQRLIEHYMSGVLVSCENVSFAGMVAGAEQVNGRWQVRWGIIPLQDRRLVVLDELSGAKDKNIIEMMSSVRSSGVAQIQKITAQETSARTRLIWISNPADGRSIREHSRGAIDAIPKLIPNPEDIARFDFAMSAATEDVGSEEINTMDHPDIPHVYTEDLCKKLITWAWSRKVDDVVIPENVEKFIYEEAEELGKQYVVDPPLVQRQNVRVKIARMAVAVAARLFSTDETGEKILVEEEHVDAAVKFLNWLYKMSSFGYLANSKRIIREQRRAERMREECRQFIMSDDNVKDALKYVVNDNKFLHRDIERFGAMTAEQAQMSIGELSRMGMVQRVDRGHIKMNTELRDIVNEIIELEEEEFERETEAEGTS